MNKINSVMPFFEVVCFLLILVAPVIDDRSSEALKLLISSIACLAVLKKAKVLHPVPRYIARAALVAVLLFYFLKTGSENLFTLILHVSLNLVGLWVIVEEFKNSRWYASASLKK